MTPLYGTTIPLALNWRVSYQLFMYNRKKGLNGFAPLGASINDSALIRELDNKLAAAGPLRFRFTDHLVGFAERVSAEVPYVRTTFPEFTDHTADIHFPNLFALATKLLGERLLDHLFIEELFVLAAALYAHDWGMAVSPAERSLIVTGDNPDSFDPKWLIPDEFDRFRKFAEANGLTLPKSEVEIGDGYWREYVRLTHAERSAIRAQRYFETIDGGVAQAVAALCKGHWLALETIDAEREFPAELNVLNARINLRALALFVRLIDLFDISEDRTPFAIWRFVSPRDPRSQLEWKKHRALRPVHTEPYLGSRCIVVDGTASDPDVYADLLDLRDYCEKQLRGTCDLLARHTDERLPFDLAPILHWNVKAQGFEPTEIQFEFDRTRMFEILGGEIYQDDPCVFLRELLQNAIDAIATRRSLQKNRPREGVVSGLIEFRVVHEFDGSCTVSCTDNGIGMDDYIIRRYLAVAGKSYYRSEDFARLGLALDPISRFGIGLLSCFMVAERIEIITRRDPILSPNAKPTRLVIVAPERQWRVYRESSECRVGTTVSVHVRGACLVNDEGQRMPKLPVTEYLSAIAGFVEFPILIEETNNFDQESKRRSVVLHPDAAPSLADEFGKDITLHQLSKEYPFEAAVVAGDVDLAKEHFASETLQIPDALLVPGCEGFVVALRLNDNNVIVKEAYDKVTDKSGVRLLRSDGTELTQCIGLHPRMREYADAASPSLTRSAARASNWSLYLDGILLAAMPAPQRSWRRHSTQAPLPLPVIRLNYRSSQVGAAVSRLTLDRDAASWQTDLWSAMVTRLSEEAGSPPTHSQAVNRATRLATRAYCYGLEITEFADLISEWPTIGAWVRSTGEPEFAAFSTEELLEFRLVPIAYQSTFEYHLSELACRATTGRRLKTAWRGPRSLIRPERSNGLDAYLLASFEKLLKRSQVVRLEFVYPPSDSLPPIPQPILTPAPDNIRTFDEILGIALEAPMLLLRKERESLAQSMPKLNSWRAFRAVPFAKPFNHSLANGSHGNSLHPTTTIVARAAAHLIAALRSSPEDNKGKYLRFLFSEAIGPFTHSDSLTVKAAQKAWNLFWTDFERSGYAPTLVRAPFPRLEDFVPGTWQSEGNYFSLFEWDEQVTYDLPSAPFGKVISEEPMTRNQARISSPAQ